MKKNASRTEGDVNTTPLRTQWQEVTLSDYVKTELEQDSQYFIHQALSTPCLDMVERVDGIYLHTPDGRKIMDFHGNSVHQLGYNHPALVDALKKQLYTLSFSPRRYANETATALAKRLVDEMGGGYRVLFTPSGTASIGVALKMVRRVNGRHKIVSLWDSFHGAGLDAISVGGEGHFRAGMGPLMAGTEHIMPYNSYRCPFGDCQNCGLKCLDYLDYLCHCEGDIGGVLMEPIRCTDVQIPPADYYIKLRNICDKHDIALIFDEIPTAFGRTGKMFAHQNYPIKPDILVLGKGLGGGLYPLSAVVASEEFNQCQDISLGHYTHEKSPLGCAIGLALMDYIDDKNLLSHVATLEQQMKRFGQHLISNYSIVGDIRVKGGLLAIELVSNRQTKEKALDVAEKILYHCLGQGLSFKVSQGNVLTLAPPLIITAEELQRALSIVEDAISSFNF